MNIKIETVQGSDLAQSDLDVVNQYRKILFNRDNVWDHQTNNYFHDRIFFLVRADNKLVAFGTIRPIALKIENEEVEIMGIQAVSSIEQRKGYGKVLMQEMTKYADENNKTLVGFCVPENAEFYIKSGLQVFPGKNLNFYHVEEDGSEYSEDGDVIYYSSVNNKVKEAIQNNKKITHQVPHW